MLVTYDFFNESGFKPIFSKSFDLDSDGDSNRFSSLRIKLDSIIESLECLTGSKVLVRVTEISWYRKSKS